MDATVQSWIDTIAGFPDWLAARVQDVPAAHYTWKPEGTEFSMVEHVCHLRDIERMEYYPHIARILEEDRPLFGDFYRSKLAVERKYQKQELARALETHRTFRGINVATARGLTDAQLAKRGTFGGVEGFPISQAIEWMTQHDANHRAQIETLIAAGRGAGVFPG